MGFVILTGASGSGKTAIAEAIAARRGGRVNVFHFDRVVVPALEEMVIEYGSDEAWREPRHSSGWKRLLQPSVQHATHCLRDRCGCPSSRTLLPRQG